MKQGLFETNLYYNKIISELRKEKQLWKNNPCLTGKEKRNLKILSVCPKFSKRIHKIIMKLKGV